MYAVQKQVRKVVMGASVAAILATVSVGAFAQEDAKAVSAARAAYSAANTKISNEYKAARGKCSSMKGNDRGMCMIDARAERSKARTDAAAARDKAYLKANMSMSAYQQEVEDSLSGGEGG